MRVSTGTLFFCFRKLAIVTSEFFKKVYPACVIKPCLLLVVLLLLNGVSAQYCSIINSQIEGYDGTDFTFKQVFVFILDAVLVWFQIGWEGKIFLRSLKLS